LKRPYNHGEPLDQVEGVPPHHVAELTIKGVDQVLATSSVVQEELSSLSLRSRLDVIDAMGKAWYRDYEEGAHDGLRADLAKSTGYSENLIDLELSLVPSVLSASNLERNLMASLIGGSMALERFKEVDANESFLHRPAGPVFIISSGNSIVPTLIPTVLSLVTGNMTLLKPSLANYEGVIAVLRTIERAPPTPAKEAMRKALVVSYLSHDSPALEHVLTRSAVGVINFWGGEPARSVVAKKVAENHHRPRLIINGPLTGVAWVEQEAVTEDAADGLALNMLLYDQQLCSSPTAGVFIGDMANAREFAAKLANHLDRIGQDFPLSLDEGRLFALNNYRRALQLGGAFVLSSRRADNPWTIVVSKGRSSLGNAMAQFPGMGLHARRRFIELVVLEDEVGGLRLISGLPSDLAFQGIDRVQTVGLAVADDRQDAISRSLARVGVYRIVPVGDMYMRSALEPYDGISLALPFTYTVYRRDRNRLAEDGA
jgi:hypothetical protein